MVGVCRVVDDVCVVVVDDEVKIAWLLSSFVAARWYDHGKTRLRSGPGWARGSDQEDRLLCE